MSWLPFSNPETTTSLASFKGPSSRYSAFAVVIDTNFLTNRSCNTITRAPNFPRVSLEFHVPFDNIFIRRLLVFCLQRIFVMFMLCEGHVCSIQALMLYFFNLHSHLQLYKVSDIRPPIFRSFFISVSFFLSKQDGYRVKAAFVSSHFKNAPLRTSYFSTIFNSRHKICCLNLSWMTKHFFTISVQIFTSVTSSTQKDYSHKYKLSKTVPSDKKSNCRTCTEWCQMPFIIKAKRFHYRHYHGLSQ